MWEDPIVAEVRRTREELSAKFGFDLKAIFTDIRDRQAALGERLVHMRTERLPEQGEAPEPSLCATLLTPHT